MIAWLDVAEPLPEGEIRGLHGLLQHRAVDLVGDCIEEGGVALELREPERRPQPPHHRVHHVGDDILRMLELDTGEKAGVAGDIRDHQTGGIRVAEASSCPSLVTPEKAPWAIAKSLAPRTGEREENGTRSATDVMRFDVADGVILDPRTATELGPFIPRGSRPSPGNAGAFLQYIPDHRPAGCAAMMPLA